MAKRLRPLTSIPEVAGSNPGLAVAPLDKALYPHCLVFRWRLKAVGPVYRRVISYMHVKEPTSPLAKSREKSWSSGQTLQTAAILGW